MAGYEAVIGAIRQAAQSAGSAAEQVNGVDLGGSVNAVGAAMPGAKAAGAASQLGSVWSQKITAWSNDMKVHAEGLRAAADRYAGNEQAANRDLRAAARPASGQQPN